MPCYRALLASCFLEEPSIAAAIATGLLAGFSTVRQSVHFAHHHRVTSFIEVATKVSLSRVTTDASARATQESPSSGRLQVALTATASVRSAISVPLSATD